MSSCHGAFDVRLWTDYLPLQPHLHALSQQKHLHSVQIIFDTLLIISVTSLQMRGLREQLDIIHQTGEPGQLLIYSWVGGVT